MAKRDSLKLSIFSLLTSPDGWNLRTPTPLQEAICRIVDGEPLGKLATHPHVVESLGVSGLDLGGPPFEVLLLSGIRTGKSMWASCLASRNALTCDTSRVSPGDLVRSSVLSLTRDLAEPTVAHLKAPFVGSKVLRPFVVGTPTSEGLTVRQPGGTKVEICVASGSRAGGSLVARWSAGVVWDEMARMVGKDEGVVNFVHSREAVVGRLLPGAQLISISSPWAPSGPAFDMFTDNFGKPSRDLVVIRARADYLNPYYWTSGRIADLERRDPQAYRTDFLAEFADGSSNLITAETMDRCCREDGADLPPWPGCEYVAAMDPATKGNAWTFVIATKRDGKKFVVCHRQWTPPKGSSLNAKNTLREIALLCSKYGVDTVVSDQWGNDLIRELAEGFGIHVSLFSWTASNKASTFDRLEKEMAMGMVSLPNDRTIRGDLLLTRRVATSNGVKIFFPRTGDGRHGDYAPAIALALRRYLEEPSDTGPAEGTAEWFCVAQERAKREHAERVEREANRALDWWDA